MIDLIRLFVANTRLRFVEWRTRPEYAYIDRVAEKVGHL